MRISTGLLDQIVAHAREEAPNECCGMIAARDGKAIEVHRARNLAASPLRFEIEGREQIRIHNAIEDAGAELGAIYHSHTRTAPVPSQTDINFGNHWPGVMWIIVGLAGGGEVDIRTWRIDDGQVAEAELVVQ
ncbi:MAG: M67 family metallopeptidase [Solirubrobacteraceae bacterium]